MTWEVFRVRTTAVLTKEETEPQAEISYKP